MLSERERQNIDAALERYTDTVYRLAYVYTKNRSDAEDVTQDVFLKLLRALPDFSDEEHIKAWLLRVTANTAKDYLRAFWRSKTDGISDSVACHDSYNEDSLVEKVLALPEKYRTVLYLFYYEDYSTARLAKTLSMNEATVRTRLKRGRELLRELIGENCNEG